MLVTELKPTHHFTLAVYANGYIGAQFALHVGPGIDHEDWSHAEGKTESEAICKAYLKAKTKTRKEV